MNSSAVLRRADKVMGVAKRAYDLAAPGIGFLFGLNVPTRSIDPQTIYSIKEIAKLMKVRDLKALRELIDSGQIRGRKVGKEHVVLGQSILDFFDAESNDLEPKEE